MMTSIYSGVSGLKAQQTKLNVIGNNIANVNTTGYKAQTVSFADLLSQTISGATAANTATGRGGTNAKQIGTGVSVAATTTITTVGSTQSTGNANDVAISGNGYFIVQGGGNGAYQFTRAGNFGVDSSGNLTVNGYNICGWPDYSTDANGNYAFDTDKAVSPLNLFSNGKKVLAASATTKSTLTGAIDASANAKGTITSATEADGTTTLTVYDSLGNDYNVQVSLYKSYIDSSDPANPVTYWQWEAGTSDSNMAASGSGLIAFDKNGKIITTNDAYNATPSITLTPTNSNASAAAFSVSLDMTNVTSSANTASLTNTSDGYPAGTLQDFSIGSDGVITGVYSNGYTQPLGVIALANFTNPAGLLKIGDNLYSTTVNSGEFTGGVIAGSGGTGSLSAGTLEMSNVDLSEQFSEMMITQRAYQANSKIISTSDECLETVINMVR